MARQGRCETGEAVITTAGKLPANYVIHTVGPVWNGGNRNEDEKLRSCYINSLKLAVEYGCKTVAFPCISTGVYRFPKESAAKIAVDTIKRCLEEYNQLEKVILVAFDRESFELLQKESGV